MKNYITKYIFALVFLLLFPLYGGYAQEVQKRKVQAVEGEIAGGAIIGLNKVGYEVNHLGYVLRGEIRYNFPSSAFDLGLGSQFARFNRSSSESHQYAAYSSIQLYIVTNYNWRMNDRFNCFFGVAGGASCWTITSGYSISMAPNKWSPYFSPRIGVEVWNRLRFTISLNISNKESNFVGINLGYTFGGKPTK